LSRVIKLLQGSEKKKKNQEKTLNIR